MSSVSSSHPQRGRATTRSGRTADTADAAVSPESIPGRHDRPYRSTLGILRDKETDQVPGSVLLLSGPSKRNAPLGSAPRRRSASSLPSQHSEKRSLSNISRSSAKPEKKRTRDGKIILEPQPDDSQNDPLNWSAFRRDAALLSLGLYCMLGGGMTTLLAPAFNNVASTYDVSVPRVALTTGIYMLGLGLGGVIMSPTAIIFGKRPVYLITSILFILSAVWCALSPSYPSLIVARVVQGITVSPVECLPSATIAEIYFLHERAYRLGIYTLLLLGGKNLVPLVSAAITESLGWRWVFWVVATVAGLCCGLLFFLVPETFWDRTPRPNRSRGQHRARPTLANLRRWTSASHRQETDSAGGLPTTTVIDEQAYERENADTPYHSPANAEDDLIKQNRDVEATRTKTAHFDMEAGDSEESRRDSLANEPAQVIVPRSPAAVGSDIEANTGESDPPVKRAYTAKYRDAPPKTYLATLKPFPGRLSHDRWVRIAVRPFILAAYPSILWSAAVYAVSVGWLIILSESASTIYRSSAYDFTALQTGLIYISPFIGGILGTAVAGKLSDAVVRFMARRNGGLYEPEFRLVMALPVAITTTVGLMGYGWSAQSHDAWIVPTVFFGIVSFGCTLGSTTAITFAVDSYRQYAGEALVTLNFAKNVLDGFVFSLFFNEWLDGEGARKVFLALGGIELGVLLFSIPMYIYGKRARMWTVRKNFMEKF